MPLGESRRPVSDEELLVIKICEIMMEAWEKAEGEKVNISYIATFVDMAKALVDSGVVSVLD